MNERIRIRSIRLIDENGGQVGLIATEEAVKMAHDRGLDLVEIAPNAAPPVCKIMDYSKFKYSQHKKEQKDKKKRHETQIKEVRLRPITEEHDIQVKLKHSREWLSRGDKVLVVIIFKGREMTHREIGYKLLERFTNELKNIAKVEKSATKEGYKLTLTMTPLK
ncbi:MAG: translation initiation factor IF-3 [Planctomycetota bacterium]